MTLRSLPATAVDIAEWQWSDIEAHYKKLESHQLNSHSVDNWLATWSRLRALIKEALDRLYVAKTLDTQDESAESRYNKYLEQVYTPAEEHEQQLKEMLLASGLEPEGFAIPLRNMRAEAELFREENLPLLEQHKKQQTEYDKIIGAQSVEWEGEVITLPRLFQKLEQPDRSTRERAWKLGMDCYLTNREAINDLWTRMLRLRNKIAANADLPNYRDYIWQELLRLEYSPDDCREFRTAIESEVVPAVNRILERKQEALGLGQLRPWDLSVDKLNRDPLEPFADVNELIARASSIFHAVDPVLGGYFDRMQEESLLDLDNREGKAPGGYAEYFLAARRPFIFMNAVGTQWDVETILHEGGHAFHIFESADLPYVQQLEIPSEFAEVASMAMELLSAPYLTKDAGGFYTEADAARSRIAHLERIIRFLPFMAVVDAFQHWVHEGMHPPTPEECDEYWGQLWDRFMQGVDWTGLEVYKKTGWHRLLHIYNYPFYYVNYGLAQLGAVQVWNNATSDQASAVSKYRKALALGGTVSLVELYQSAGAKLAFDAKTVGEAVALLETTLAELEQQETG